ncbi:cytochrome P450 [Pluteus cervinus]|uniref:Cytochrome P450 n=1 Tax=Pluteus cervinus TaxID=181527 RepID=A0ACD3BB27_9AGAR|nr:cytochrome P450 [Pluteus cervinus]
MITILQAFGLSLFSWGLWRLFRAYVAKTDLDNIPGPRATSFWTGNFHQIFNPNGWDFHKAIALKFGSVIRINTFLGGRMLYVFDPKAMHHILVKDQYIYEETSSFIENNRIIFGEGLLSTLGEQHRKQRKMLNPVFSIAHMRQMIPTFYEVANKLGQAVEVKVKSKVEEIDMLEWMTRTALELIGQSGLGYSFDSLVDNAPQHPYSISVKQLVPVGFRLFFLRIYVLPRIAGWGSPAFRRAVVDLLQVPSKTIRQMRDIVDLMHQTSLEIIQQKQKALKEGDEAVSQQIGHGKDIVSILSRFSVFGVRRRL